MTRKTVGLNNPKQGIAEKHTHLPSQEIFIESWQDELPELNEEMDLTVEEDEFLERIWELLRVEYERDPESFRKQWRQELAGQPPLELPPTWPEE